MCSQKKSRYQLFRKEFVLNFYNIFKVAEEMGVDRVEAANQRINFLEEELETLNKLYINSKTIIDAVFVNNRREPIREEIAFLEKNKELKEFTDRITDEDIVNARNYPIEQIIQFDARGKAIAWCHDDKNPSLTHWKNGNKARCFACSENFDSIAAAMHLWNLSFVEAVRSLTR